jgi:hypothetical protein
VQPVTVKTQAVAKPTETRDLTKVDFLMHTFPKK